MSQKSFLFIGGPIDGRVSAIELNKEGKPPSCYYVVSLDASPATMIGPPTISPPRRHEEAYYVHGFGGALFYLHESLSCLPDSLSLRDNEWFVRLLENYRPDPFKKGKK